jgi:hypothetical protein
MNKKFFPADIASWLEPRRFIICVILLSGSIYLYISTILIHLAAVAGLFFLCKGMNFNTRTAATASLIFAVLPINTEAIVWMGARFDLLSACLTIWTVFLYLKYRSTKRPLFYFWALVCFSFAVFSKENAYVTPFILLSLESLIVVKRRWKPVFGFFLVAIVFLIYRWYVLGGIGGYTDASGAPSTFNVGIKTLIGLFSRVPAQSLLGFNWAHTFFTEVAILASLTSSILLITALAAKSRSLRLKRLLFCFSWILLTVIPAHPLLFINANLTNSRILYLGSAGAAVLVGQLISSIETLQTRWIIRGMMVSLFCISSLLNLGAWRYTSGLSKKLLTEISQLEPFPPPDTLFIFHNTPLAVRGVFNLHVGLRDAIRITYNRNDLFAVRHGERAAGNGSDSPPRTVIDLEWKENGEFLLKRLGKTHP